MNSNTYNKLTDDVINQIKDFEHSYSRLTQKQKSLIDELISNEELREAVEILSKIFRTSMDLVL